MLRKKSSLERFVTGIKGDSLPSEEFVSEDSCQSLHSMNLPLSHETSFLVTKRNIVRQRFI